MAKKQDVTVVSDLIGRANFTVSAKGHLVDGKIVGAVPSTSFSIEVTYANQIEKMEYAVPTSIICLQQMLRDEYLANGKFSFAPGTRIKVGANGRYTRPAPMPTKEQVANATLAQKIAMLEALGVPVPEEWMRPPVVTEKSDQSESEADDDADGDGAMRYDEDVLSTLTLAKLRVLAQNEELEGYDELTKDELVMELALIEK